MCSVLFTQALLLYASVDVTEEKSIDVWMVDAQLVHTRRSLLCVAAVMTTLRLQHKCDIQYVKLQMYPTCIIILVYSQLKMVKLELKPNKIIAMVSTNSFRHSCLEFQYH